MKKPLLTIVILAVVIVGGYIAYDQLAGDKETQNQNSATNQLVGADEDEHGCRASAGYSWCEQKQKCLRTWEETCTDAEADNVYVHDDFTITALKGWIQNQLPSTLVSFYNADERHPDGSAALNINFKSYLAVSFETAAGQTFDEINATVTESIQSLIPTAETVSSSDETVNGLPARFTVMTMTQQEVDYEVFVAIVLDEEHDRYYSVSCNTTVEKWDEYEADFLAAARSFTIK